MTNTKTQLQDFETDSLPLSAYLFCNACNLKQIKASSIQGKYLFVFYPNQKIQELESEFFSFKAIVAPQSYYSAIRDLKRLLIEYKKSKE